MSMVEMACCTGASSYVSVSRWQRLIDLCGPETVSDRALLNKQLAQKKRVNWLRDSDVWFIFLSSACQAEGSLNDFD